MTAPALPEDVERAKVAAWEAAHDSLRDDVLHNADGFDNDIVNHFLGMIDDADQRPYAAIATHVAPPVTDSARAARRDAALRLLDTPITRDGFDGFFVRLGKLTKFMEDVEGWLSAAPRPAPPVSASFDAGYLSLLLSRLSPAEWGVLPLNLMPGKRQLCHVESDEGAPAGQGVGVCSVPKRYERLASFMVGAVNALAAHLRPKPGVKPESAGCGGAPRAPDSPSFDAALAALDVENDYAPDRGTTYAIVGLDDVRAAHAEAVRVAVEAERARCMADCDAIYASVIGCADDDGNFRVGIQAGAQRCSAAIRARGVAKPRTDGEAATRSGEGAKS